MSLKDVYVTRHSVVRAKVVQVRVANSRLHVWRALHRNSFMLIKSTHNITNTENMTHVTRDVFTSETTTKYYPTVMSTTHESHYIRYSRITTT
jgi:hypothetical protein